LWDCKQKLEEKVRRLQNVEKKTVVVEMSSSPITSSTFDNINCILVVCKNTNDCVVSPIFEKHSMSIGSQLLSKMEYIGGELGKNGQGIVFLITPDMKSPRTCLGYDVVVSSLPTSGLVTTR
jgi:hypothetical protein